MKNESLPVQAAPSTLSDLKMRRPYEAPAVSHLGAWTALTLAVSGPVSGTIFEGLSVVKNG